MVVKPNRYRISVTCADPVLLVGQMTNQGFRMNEIQKIDEIHIAFFCDIKQYALVCCFLDTHKYSYTVTQMGGIRRFTCFIKQRAILLLSIILLLTATVFLPSRILFIKISGNESIPTSYILDMANSCGIRFFASRKELRSEKVKNALLQAIPQLQWAGINTSGCVATIQVREKQYREQQSTQSNGNIIALRDGIIYSCTVESGTQLCKVGQAVQKDQLLVSEYLDVGLHVKQIPVKAEIMGLTNRNISIVTPNCFRNQAVSTKESVQFSLRIGKNIIKFYKGSGISSATCDKIYMEKSVTLPGGFTLPVSFICVRVVEYQTRLQTEEKLHNYQWMADYGQHYLTQQMLAGKILYQDESFQMTGDTCQYFAHCVCLEMIGKYKFEEKVKQYGENY